MLINASKELAPYIEQIQVNVVFGALCYVVIVKGCAFAEVRTCVDEVLHHEGNYTGTHLGNMIEHSINNANGKITTWLLIYLHDGELIQQRIELSVNFDEKKIEVLNSEVCTCGD